MDLSRRSFLKGAALTTVAMATEGGLKMGVAQAQEAAPAEQAGPPYDLLLTGGRVIDPDSGRDGRFDVAFAGDKVVAIEPGINPSMAKQVVKVDGSMVLPGLVDPHCHIVTGLGDGIAPDKVGVERGFTTLADGGSLGIANYGVFKPVQDANKTRTFAWLNISSVGQTDTQMGECWMIALMRVEEAVEMAKANPDTIVGFKARLSTYVTGGGDLAVLDLLLEAGEKSGLPIMIHVGDTQHGLGAILNKLRPGDVVSHFMTPRKNGILGIGYFPGAKLIPEAAAAQDRGVIMDSARGRNHIGFPQMQAWVEAGRLPDTLSSDVTLPGSTDPMVAVLPTASALMAFGAKMEELFPRMTINCAKALRKDSMGIGKLQVGGIGDATVLKVENGDFTFTDVNGWPKKGNRRLVATGVVRAGAYSEVAVPKY